MIALLEKELRCALRERLVWVLLAAVPLLVMLEGFLSSGGCEPGRDGAAAMGRGMLASGWQTQTILLTLFLPIYSALNLVRERERRTLDPLLTASEKAEALLLGKLLAPAAIGILGALLSLPALLALGNLGGVAPWEPLAGFVLIVPTALASSAAGLAAGALGRTSAVALILATMAGAVTTLGNLTLARTSVYSALAASFPLGCSTLLLNSRSARWAGHDTWPLPWCLLFQGLLTVVLFCMALPAFARPYRRRSLPVRLSAVALLALLLWLSSGLDPFQPGLVWLVVPCLATLAVVSSLGAMVALALERLDRAGVVYSLDGSREALDTASAGWLRKALMSRTCLGLIPWLATLPAIAALAVRLEPQELDGPLMGALLLAVTLWTLGWSLFCLGFSGLFRRNWRGWQPASLTQLGPVIALVAGGFLEARGSPGRRACLELPSLMAGLMKEPWELVPELHLRILEGAAGLLFASIALFALGWWLERRRSHPR